MIRTCTLCGAKYQTVIEKDVSYCHKCLLELFTSRTNRMLLIVSEQTDNSLKRIVGLCHMLLANTQLEQSRRARLQTKLLKQARRR